MSTIVRTYALGNRDDITAISSTQSTKYKLGDRVVIYDDSKKVTTEYMYVYANGGCTKYGVYDIAYTGTAGQEVQAIAVASSAVYSLKCVAQVTITNTYYGWVAVKGYVTYLATSSTATANSYGKAANGVNTATNETATRGTNSIIMCITTASGTSTVGYLLGERSVVA
jgi:hypothetical protein